MLLSVSVWSGAAGDMSPSVQALFHWLSALIALPAVAYAGQPFFRSAAQALRARRLNMDVPISLGVTLATAMSLYQTTRGSEQVYFDAAVTLLFFLLIGRYLDQRMRTRAAGAAANLLGLRGVCGDRHRGRRHHATRLLPAAARARHAHPDRGGRAHCRRRPRGRGPRRGRREPDHRRDRAAHRSAPGALIYAGTVNLSGSLVTEATATDQNTLLAEIARLMAAAEQGRGRYVRLADRAARFYAPAVHVLGLATFLGWLATGHGWESGADRRHRRAHHHLPVRAGAGRAGRAGRRHQPAVRQGRAGQGADGLERLSEVDTIVFDKTGTLTLGEPSLAADQQRQRRRPRRAPLASPPPAAIPTRAPWCAPREAGGPRRRRPAADVREVAGFGLERIGPHGTERLGSAAWCGAEPSRARPRPCGIAAGRRHRTVALAFEDRLRSDAAGVVARCTGRASHTELLSGDRRGRGRGRRRASRHRPLAWPAPLPAGKIARLEALKAAAARC